MRGSDYSTISYTNATTYPNTMKKPKAKAVSITTKYSSVLPNARTKSDMWYTPHAQAAQTVSYQLPLTTKNEQQQNDGRSIQYQQRLKVMHNYNNVLDRKLLTNN